MQQCTCMIKSLAFLNIYCYSKLTLIYIIIKRLIFESTPLGPEDFVPATLNDRSTGADDAGTLTATWAMFGYLLQLLLQYIAYSGQPFLLPRVLLYSCFKSAYK